MESIEPSMASMGKSLLQHEPRGLWSMDSWHTLANRRKGLDLLASNIQAGSSSREVGITLPFFL